MEVFITEYWNSYLNKFSAVDKDIYFFEEYVRLYASQLGQVYCLVVEEADKYMIFPFLRRSFSFNGNVYYDFETAYGYGGPLYNTEDEHFRLAALTALYKKFLEENYVAGFVRFHPLLNNYRFFEHIGNVILDRMTVFMDLSLSEDEIWMNEIHTKNRNVIKKAQKNGLNFLVDKDFKYLSQFIYLYNSTMDKLSADSFYYFDETYYLNLKNTLTKSFLGLVEYNGQIISAAIFFYEGLYGHYHLSGSDRNFLKLSPNNFMLYNAALELKRLGVTSFHLGGGTTSDGHDSLFCFKERFSNHKNQFAIGKLIFNRDVYRSLCQQWEEKYPDKVDAYKHFLLKYKY